MLIVWLKVISIPRQLFFRQTKKIVLLVFIDLQSLLITCTIQIYPLGQIKDEEQAILINQNMGFQSGTVPPPLLFIQTNVFLSTIQYPQSLDWIDQYHLTDNTIINIYHYNMEEEKPLQTARRQKTKQIKFDKWIFSLSINHSNEVFISFNDYDQKKSYTCRKVLEKIHYQTILVGLSKSNLPIVSAKMNFTDSQRPFLLIRVKHEFLNQFQEKMEFSSDNLPKQIFQKYKQLQRSTIELKSLKQKVIDTVGVCSDSGRRHKQKQKPIQIQIAYLFASTSASLWLNFIGLKENNINIKLQNIDDTGLKIPSNLFPEEGLYIMGNFQVVIIGDCRNYKKGKVTIDGKFEGIEYSVKYERVVKSQPVNFAEVGKGALVLGIFIFSAYLATKIGIFGGASENL